MSQQAVLTPGQLASSPERAIGLIGEIKDRLAEINPDFIGVEPHMLLAQVRERGIKATLESIFSTEPRRQALAKAFEDDTQLVAHIESLERSLTALRCSKVSEDLFLPREQEAFIKFKSYLDQVQCFAGIEITSDKLNDLRLMLSKYKDMLHNMRNIMQYSGLCISAFSDTEVLEWNSTLEAVTGYDKAFIQNGVKENGMDWLRVLLYGHDPKELARVRGDLSGVESQGQEGYNDNVYRLRRKDGRIVSVTWNTHPRFDGPGSVRVGMALDSDVMREYYDSLESLSVDDLISFEGPEGLELLIDKLEHLAQERLDGALPLGPEDKKELCEIAKSLLAGHAQFVELLVRLPLLININSRTGAPRVWNPAQEAIFGCTLDELRVSGENPIEKFYGHSQKARDEVEKAIAFLNGGRFYHGRLFPLRNATGEMYNIYWNSFPIVRRGRVEGNMRIGEVGPMDLLD